MLPVVPVDMPVDPDVPERRDLRLCLVVVVPVVDDIESLPVDGVDMVPDGDDIVSPGIAPVPVPVPDDPAVPDPIVPVVEPVEPPLEPAIWALAAVASIAAAITINVFMMMFL